MDMITLREHIVYNTINPGIGPWEWGGLGRCVIENWYFILISYNSRKIETSCRGAEGLFTALIDISYQDHTIVWNSKPLDDISVLKY